MQIKYVNGVQLQWISAFINREVSKAIESGYAYIKKTSFIVVSIHMS